MLLWIAKSTMQHFYCSIFLLHKGDYMQHWIAIFLHFICSYILVQFFGIVIISRSLKWTQEIKRDSTLSQRVDRKISWAKYWVATLQYNRSISSEVLLATAVSISVKWLCAQSSLNIQSHGYRTIFYATRIIWHWSQLEHFSISACVQSVF